MKRFKIQRAKGPKLKKGAKVHQKSTKSPSKVHPQGAELRVFFAGVDLLDSWTFEVVASWELWTIGLQIWTLRFRPHFGEASSLSSWLLLTILVMQNEQPSHLKETLQKRHSTIAAVRFCFSVFY